MPDRIRIGGLSHEGDDRLPQPLGAGQDLTHEGRSDSPALMLGSNAERSEAQGGCTRDMAAGAREEIGRASCRERVYDDV